MFFNLKGKGYLFRKSKANTCKTNKNEFILNSKIESNDFLKVI